MKIVDRKTFLSLPAGTVYSEYEPCIFKGLMVKANEPGTWFGKDFLYYDLIAPVDSFDDTDFFKKCEEASRGEDIELDFNSTSRDGVFDDKQLYAVYSKKNVQELIERLKVACA